LFDQYPDIKVAFDLVQGLRNIFNTATSVQTAYTKLAHWYKDVENTGFRAFNTIANTITRLNTKTCGVTKEDRTLE
jgi:hypothetical protein